VVGCRIAAQEEMYLARQTYTASLTRKVLLSEPAQCFHLEFRVKELERFDFTAGQFITAVVTDHNGKQQTRAYSIASAPRASHFDLCLNRVGEGLFSNQLCDLEIGQTLEFHGPHGFFTLRSPSTDSIFIATETGIAPIRGFVQDLFPESGPERGDDGRGQGCEFWLVYGTRYETEIYYEDYFEKIAATHKNFHYLKTLSQPGDLWAGAHGSVQEVAAQIAEQHKQKMPPIHENGAFNIHAYICGLNEMVSATRSRLAGLGWARKQIVFERYD
jgi:ferredoxin-NADP reductase